MCRFYSACQSDRASEIRHIHRSVQDRFLMIRLATLFAIPMLLNQHWWQDSKAGGDCVQMNDVLVELKSWVVGECCASIGRAILCKIREKFACKVQLVTDDLLTNHIRAKTISQFQQSGFFWQPCGVLTYYPTLCKTLTNDLAGVR